MYKPNRHYRVRNENIRSRTGLSLGTVGQIQHNSLSRPRSTNVHKILSDWHFFGYVHAVHGKRIKKKAKEEVGGHGEV